MTWHFLPLLLFILADRARAPPFSLAFFLFCEELRTLLWETWFCSRCSTPAQIGPPKQFYCRHFRFDPYGDHLQTCQNQSSALPAHDWVAYRLSLMLRSIGHCQSSQDHTNSRKWSRRQWDKGFRCFSSRTRQLSWILRWRMTTDFGFYNEAWPLRTIKFTPKMLTNSQWWRPEALGRADMKK